MQFKMKGIIKSVQKAPNALNWYYCWSILFLFIGCGVKMNTVQAQNTEEHAIIDYILENIKGKIFHKTISTTFFDEDLENFVGTINFSLCTENIDSIETELTISEMEFLEMGLRELKTKKVNGNLAKFPKKITNKKKDAYFISMPIVFRNGKHAIYYSETNGGGQFNLLVKKGSRWEGSCSSMVWIE